MAKTGRKPIGETAKIAYSTKLPEEQVMFLRSLPNAAAWLSEAIGAIRMYGAWMEEFKETPAPRDAGVKWVVDGDEGESAYTVVQNAAGVLAQGDSVSMYAAGGGEIHEVYGAEFHQVERRLPPELEGDAEPIKSPHWGVLEIGGK